MRYEDFILQVELHDEAVCRLRVDSPAGSGSRTFELPPELLTERLPEGFGSDEARKVGARLFETVFAGEVGHLYYGSLARISEQGRLRLLIKLQPRSPGFATLASLPWELLHDPRDGFLSLHRQRSIVRHMELQRPESVEPLNGPLRILVAAARPNQVPELQWRHELEALLDLQTGARELDVVVLEPVTSETLHEALRAGVEEGRPFHVLHFVGHGEGRAGRGHLIFEDSRGRPAKMDGESLVTELRGFPNLRLVFLNACRSGRTDGLESPLAGVATALVHGGVPAVIAMQHSISDGASLELSRVFYRCLVSGEPVDSALTEGRLAVRRHERAAVEWSTPVLFGRTAKGQPLWAPSPPRKVSVLRRVLGAAVLVSLLLVTFGAYGWYTNLRSAQLEQAAELRSVHIARLEEQRVARAARLNQEGIALLDQRNLGGAREIFLDALGADPDNPAIHANLGELESLDGHRTIALEYYREAARLDPEDGLHAYNVGNLLAFSGHFEEALDPLRQAVDLDPGNAAAWNELASVYRELGRLDEASRAVQKGLDASSTFAPLYKNEARIALLRNELGRALRGLEKAQDHAVGTGDLWDQQELHFLYAQAYLGLDRKPEGCQSLAALASLDPKDIGRYAEEANHLRRLHNCSTTEENHA